ncbi:MAG: PrgI family protein [Ruminococcus sp.]|nr:PrgI family protein [Ruminococcus sp.]MCM1380976.1 PrgI family protein [Muribaculaceae bacterium]MCM1479481.1 PrgI family protein [Muribaculaceae bacterium]
MGVMRRSVPAEIKSFKEKFFFGLTVRQLVCGAGILALAIPTGIFGSKIMSQDMVGWLIILEVAPLAAIGWASYNDMPIEKIGKKALAYYLGIQKRKLKYTPPEAAVHKELIKLELEAVTAERNEELRQEKERLKFEKKAAKKNKKHKKSKKKEDESI